MRHGGSGPKPGIVVNTISSKQTGKKPPSTEDKQKNLIGILSSVDWRDGCLNAASDKFPAIITYLSQLLAHDVTRSAPADTRFEVAAGNLKKGRSNLRSSGLLLHSVYGEGTHLDRQLFQNTDENDRISTPRFKLTHLNTGAPSLSVMPAFWMPVQSKTPARKLYPLIGDTRNADTPMLLWTTLEFMKLHNRLVEVSTGQNSNLRFQQARLRVVLTWHNIIEHELIPALTGHGPHKLMQPKTGKVSDADLFHGLMRAFHALPLNNYTLASDSGGGADSGRALKQLMSQDATLASVDATRTWDESFEKALRHWHRDWHVNLALLTDPGGPNLTAFTPSFACVFGETGIILKDFEAAGKFGVSPLEADEDLENHAKQLLALLASKFPKTPLPSVTDLPLSVGFLAETQTKSANGGALGPIGARIFRVGMRSMIKRVERQLDQVISARDRTALKTTLPKSFKEMMQYKPTKLIA